MAFWLCRSKNAAFLVSHDRGHDWVSINVCRERREATQIASSHLKWIQEKSQAYTLLDYILYALED